MPPYIDPLRAALHLEDDAETYSLLLESFVTILKRALPNASEEQWTTDLVEEVRRKHGDIVRTRQQMGAVVRFAQSVARLNILNSADEDVGFPDLEYPDPEDFERMVWEMVEE
ncbi:hypothetical protein PLICRDRAFT_173287 [Plicaturopsis crispa FD-325 SS-3]|nr:hypothetical protein PLICRDRAFT_173287 [Plicaturopsis crispa FD-325 SS-3]